MPPGNLLTPLGDLWQTTPDSSLTACFTMFYLICKALKKNVLCEQWAVTILTLCSETNQRHPVAKTRVAPNTACHWVPSIILSTHMSSSLLWPLKSSLEIQTAWDVLYTWAAVLNSLNILVFCIIITTDTVSFYEFVLCYWWQKISRAHTILDLSEVAAAFPDFLLGVIYSLAF